MCLFLFNWLINTSYKWVIWWLRSKQSERDSYKELHNKKLGTFSLVVCRWASKVSEAIKGANTIEIASFLLWFLLINNMVGETLFSPTPPICKLVRRLDKIKKWICWTKLQVLKKLLWEQTWAPELIFVYKSIADPTTLFLFIIIECISQVSTFQFSTTIGIMPIMAVAHSSLAICAEIHHDYSNSYKPITTFINSSICSSLWSFSHYT